MTKTKLFASAAIYLFILSSFIVSKNEVLGKWNWLHIIDTESKKVLRIEDISIGMADKLTTEFKEDNSYVESKTNSKQNKTSTTNGEWKLEFDGTVLSLKPADKWLPTPIVSCKGDTMVIQMSPVKHLVLVKQK